MNGYIEKIQQYKQNYPKTWSQQLQRDDDFVLFIKEQTRWMDEKSKFSERIFNLENNITSYRKCRCGRIITNSKAETCRTKGCDAFKDLLNKRRDKEKHRQSVIKTYTDGTRNDMSGTDRINISYKNQQEMLDSIVDIYSLFETIETLKPIYRNYFGKSGNRKLIRDNPKLYKSVKHHTEELRSKSTTQLRFTGELTFLCEYDGDINRLKCERCDSVVSYNPEKKEFKKRCDYHSIKFGSRQYFMEKYGQEWEDKFQENIKKYSMFSKISQELFWFVANEVGIDDCEFGEYGGEKRFFTSKEDRLYLGSDQKYCFYLDFVYRNRIVEFDGDYWHKTTDQYDMKRDIVLERSGYKVLRIKEVDYRTDKKQTIQKCVDFLRQE